MCARDNGGIPYLGRVIERTALLDRLHSLRQRPMMVVASSGYGKTCLAAQVALTFDSVRWVDCFGSAPDTGAILSAARSLSCAAGATDLAASDQQDWLRALSEIPRCGVRESMCLVLDDADLCSSQDAVDELCRAAQLLLEARCVLVVTARDLPRGASRASQRLELITEDDLRLTLAEATDVAELLMGASVSNEVVHDLWEASKGHAALFVVMIRAAEGWTTGPRVVPAFARLVEKIISDHLDADDRRVLTIAAMMKSGSSRELEEIGEPGARGALLRTVAVLPLLTAQTALHEVLNGAVRFNVHDLLVEFMLNVSEPGVAECQILASVEALIGRGDYRRACEIVALASPAAVLRFLGVHGFACLQRGAGSRMRALLDTVPLADVMGSARIMELWSDVLLGDDHFEEALSKARAARVLALHAGDLDIAAYATANCLIALRLMNRWEEAAGLLSQVPSQLELADVTPAAKAALMRSAAPMYFLGGDYERGELLLRQGHEMGRDGDDRGLAGSREAGQILAIVPCLRSGDFATTGRLLSPYAAMDEGTLAQRADARGNLAAALLETGRSDRAGSLLTVVVDAAHDSSLVHFLPVLGCVEFAQGQEPEGLTSVTEGIRRALLAGAEAEAAQSRVYEAMLLRAAGRLEDSLTSAERAYERLCVQDFIDFRRLAALEVSASLLALGDVSAARAWAEPVVEDGFGENLHHAFRAAMILALCDQAEGDEKGAVSRLMAHAEHLRSGNSNFQAAMYARAFPGLLGLMAMTFGVRALPVHLLRMIPSKNAERSLRACRDSLDAGEWQALGARLLGESQFAAFVDRKGRPVCYVRLFGGLNLSVGDRTVLDREWKKRKARMLFAMLVTRRGQEIAREQIFDLLWPELPADRAKNNFYVAWSAMKAALMGQTSAPGGCPYVDNSSARCRIVSETVRSDLDEFEETLRAARDADVAGNAALAIESYERIAAIYHGDLMESDPYEDWVVPLRDRYRFEFIGAMLRVAQLLLDRDDPCQALLHIRRALQVDAQREDLYQAALRCHIAAGQRSAAVETFINCRTQLSEELGLDPSAETIALYQQILVMEDRPRLDDYGLA